MSEAWKSIVSAFTYAKTLDKSFKSNKSHKLGVLTAISLIFLLLLPIVLIGIIFFGSYIVYFLIHTRFYQTSLAIVAIVLFIPILLGIIVLFLCAGKLTSFLVSLLRGDDTTGKIYSKKHRGGYKGLLIILIYLIPSILCSSVVWGLELGEMGSAHVVSIPIIYPFGFLLPIILGFITMSIGFFGLKRFAETNKFSSAFNISAIKSHISSKYIRCLLIWFAMILITVHIIPLFIILTLICIYTNPLIILIPITLLILLSVFLPKIITAFAHNVAECYAIKESFLLSSSDKNPVSNVDSNSKTSFVWKKVLIGVIIAVVALSCLFTAGYIVGSIADKNQANNIPKDMMQEKDAEIINPDSGGKPTYPTPMQTLTPPLYGVPQSNELSSIKLTKETEVLEYD